MRVSVAPWSGTTGAWVHEAPDQKDREDRPFDDPTATAEPDDTPTPSAAPTATSTSAAAEEAGDGADTASSLFYRNQEWIEGLGVEDLDLQDVDAVFWHVFSKLPDEVLVYPSENYYYFTMYVDRRQIWGNVRLAAGRRENGVLSFAYFEFKESPYVTDPRVRVSKFFTDADGVVITEIDPFRFVVRFNRREVIFNLLKLPQDPPKLFTLPPDETFVMRTFDESGYQFFLLFNEVRNYLFWVLNEEDPPLDFLEPLADDLLVGRRSGFVFLIDETNIAEYLQRASPTLRNRIDKYGYYTDRQGSSRVAVSPYYVYFSSRDLELFMDSVRAADDPYQTISRKRRPEVTSPFATPTPFPTPTFTPRPTPTPTRFPTPTYTPFSQG